MVSPNEALVRRWFQEVWNLGRVEAIAELLAKDAVVHTFGAPGQEARGPAGFRPFFDLVRGAFPDIHLTVDDMLLDRDRLACRWTARGTHIGPLGALLPTGRTFALTGMSMVRIREGQITEAWYSWDLHGLLEQIAPRTEPRRSALLPPPE